MMCGPDEDALKMKLHRSEGAARDLRSGLDSEREKSLDWMERHNKERNKVNLSLPPVVLSLCRVDVRSFFIIQTFKAHVNNSNAETPARGRVGRA